jgi:hypothetical protein
MFSCTDVLSAFSLLHSASCVIDNTNCATALCQPGHALLRKSSQPNNVTLMKFVSKDEFGGILIDNIRILDTDLHSFIANDLPQHATHLIATDFKKRTVSCVSGLVSNIPDRNIITPEIQEVMDPHR